MKHILLAFAFATAALAGVAACSGPAGANDTPSASIMFSGWGGRSIVNEYRLPDGTVCVSSQILFRTEAISCDFSKRRE